MDLFQVLSIILNALLGGGMLFQFFTVKALKLKANAEAEGARATAESTELDNVDKVIKMWREMTQQLKDDLLESRQRYEDVGKQVDDLRKEVNKLTTTSNKILKMLDRITHENLDKVIEQIKNEINGKAN